MPVASIINDAEVRAVWLCVRYHGHYVARAIIRPQVCEMALWLVDSNHPLELEVL